jgi:FkbM family methyltransferase
MDWLVRTMWNLRFRGKARMLSPLVPRTGFRKARVFGTRIDLDLADWVQRMMYMGCYERAETNCVCRYLRPGMTFIDVGANAGYFTYLAAPRLGPSGRIVAIEPDPVLFAKFASAVRDNQHAQVATLNVGLGRVAGELSLFIPPTGTGNRAPTMTPVVGWEEVRVPVRTLDDVLDEMRIEHVDLLKLDVEGFEGEVLAGAARALAASQIRAVLCEFNSYWLGENGTSSDQLWQTLLDFGFRTDASRPAFDAHTTVTELFVRR